mmetsp:Transcript_25377/g.72432  ORF Transcript_25377/g.72432 Transcript_25377/m.72432 type:complete len:94 (-) Transcript_25377:37-318(-)
MCEWIEGEELTATRLDIQMCEEMGEEEDDEDFASVSLVFVLQKSGSEEGVPTRHGLFGSRYAGELDKYREWSSALLPDGAVAVALCLVAQFGQ